MTIVSITILLAATSCPSMHAEASTQTDLDTIAYHILDRLPYNQHTILASIWGPVPAGTTIEGLRETVTTLTESCYVLYLDPAPHANLFHPVIYACCSTTTTHLTIIHARSPPRNYHDYHPVPTPTYLLLSTQQNRRAPIPSSTPTPVNGSNSRYAVLMNGGYCDFLNFPRYWNDLSNIYITLHAVYGFPDDHIIVLCSDGTDPAPDQENGQSSPLDLDGDGDADIMYPCTLPCVDMVFTSLAANLTAGDMLFVFTTDHGDTLGGWDTIEELWNQEILTDAHFATLLAQFPQGCQIITTLEPCYSGGFLDNIVVPPGPVIASSACNYNEPSYGMTQYDYDEYVFHWTAAMKGEDAFGNPVDADYNHNGIISFREAYDYASSHDAQPESPQYGEYPQGIGDILSLWNSNSPPENLTVNGPDHGFVNQTLTFSVSATDPEGGNVSIMLDWGDGTLSDWLGPYPSGAPANIAHSWSLPGSFALRVQARDITGLQTGWSDPFPLTILEKPNISISGLSTKNGHLRATLSNEGRTNISDLNWTISLNGGIVLLGKITDATNQTLDVGQYLVIQSRFILGFGRTIITIRVDTTGIVFQHDTNAVLFLCKIKVP